MFRVILSCLRLQVFLGTATHLRVLLCSWGAAPAPWAVTTSSHTSVTHRISSKKKKTLAILSTEIAKRALWRKENQETWIELDPQEYLLQPTHFLNIELSSSQPNSTVLRGQGPRSFILLCNYWKMLGKLLSSLFLSSFPLKVLARHVSFLNLT